MGPRVKPEDDIERVDDDGEVVDRLTMRVRERAHFKHASRWRFRRAVHPDRISFPMMWPSVPGGLPGAF